MNSPVTLAQWRTYLSEQRRQCAERYQADRDPTVFFKAYTRAVDNILRTLWQQNGLHGSLLAVGGYGRAQLFPHSDIDILILVDSHEHKDQIGQFISQLWDIGLEIGHSTRTLEECITAAKDDITIETNLLEKRWLAGNEQGFGVLEIALESQRDWLRFCDGKIHEQQQRHCKYLDAGSNLEPNLKESPGGLRDIQTVLWISKIMGLGGGWRTLAQQEVLTYAEARLIRYAERLLHKLRIDLHLLSGRREDRLIFDLQNGLANLWHFSDRPDRLGSEQVMQLYFRAAKSIRQLNEVLLPNLRGRLVSAIPRQIERVHKHFIAVNGLLDSTNSDVFKQFPGAIFEAFLVLQQQLQILGFSPHLLRLLWLERRQIDARFRHNPLHKTLFIDLFKQGTGLTHTLRRMNLYGILGKYLPNFGRIVGQMQHDLFHVYTVDEHILMVVRNLRRLACAEFSHEYPKMSQLIGEFERQEVLYLAALFHDIAKGRGGDHSLLGMKEAEGFCRQHQLNAQDSELIVWLVKEHLTMSKVAQKQDIYDPSVVQAFAQNVKTMRRLNALYLLTVADIRGTNPKLWNAWRAKLLEDLYQLTQRALLHGDDISIASELEQRKEQAWGKLQEMGVTEAPLRTFWKTLDTVYFLRHSTEEMVWHARALSPFVSTEHPIVRTLLSPTRETLRIVVYCPDKPALFAHICSFFAQTNYSIADAKIYTTTIGYALDTFNVLLTPAHSTYLDEIEERMESLLFTYLQNLPPLRVIRGGRVNRHLKYFPIIPQVTISADNKADFFTLSIIAGDRPGLLASVAKVLAEFGVSVHLAKIMTLGSRVEDAFVLSGECLREDRQQLALEKAIREML